MTDAGPRPPFVLVHGAFHGGWCWAPVARLLRAAGHEVFAPSQTGLGDRRHLMSAAISMETFVLDIANLIAFEDLGDVVLVGHSFGARTAAGVADRMPERLRRLVFLDGGLPLDGRSRLEAMPPEARAARIAAAEAFDGGLSVPPPPAKNFGITDPDLAARVDGLLTPQPLGADATALVLRHPIGNGVPATYVRCTQPLFPVIEPSAAFARAQPGWRHVDLAAGHDAMLSHPEALTAALLAEVDPPPPDHL